MKILAPAKINWFLHVGDRRDDGYHEILTLMQFIELYDEIEIEPEKDIIVESDLDFPQEQNIAYKAANKIKKETNYPGGARIRIKKNIPYGAGLGGGSSDGAFTLMALNKLWGLGLSSEKLLEIGASIGSDIAFFLNGPSAIVRGKGEIVEKIDIKEPATILLVKPDFPVSTSWAYSEFDRIKKESKITDYHSVRLNYEFIKTCLQLTPLSEELFKPEIFRNDLENPVFRHHPVLKEIKLRLLNEGAIYSVMTGSGSALFGVFRKEEEAIRASKAFKGLWTRPVRTII